MLSSRNRDSTAGFPMWPGISEAGCGLVPVSECPQWEIVGRGLSQLSSPGSHEKPMQIGTAGPSERDFIASPLRSPPEYRVGEETCQSLPYSVGHHRTCSSRLSEWLLNSGAYRH